jgi:hypothetical protein
MYSCLLERQFPSVRQVNFTFTRIYTMRNASTPTAIEQFTSQKDFNEFLDVGSTPELEKVKRQLQEGIAAFPNNVRSTVKELLESRLTIVRQELAAR